MLGRKDGKRWPARWALGSLVLHALLFTFAATHREHVRAPGAASTKASELEIDVVPEAVATEPQPTEEQAALDPSALPANHTAHAGATPQRAAPQTEADADTASETSDAANGEAPGDAAAAPSTASSGAAPHLSLAALGVDGQNPFYDRGDPASQRAAKTARIKRRLENSLAQGMLDQDVARGRSAGGPVLRSLESAVYASTVPLNGNASFIFVIDGDGKLLSGTLGDASSDREAWARVARQTAQAFASRKLLVPKGKVVRLTVAVTSHLELPSGADPGVEVDAFGLPIKKGGGPRSTKVDLLNPKSGLVPLTLLGDPADIGAKARRMVHAHVVSEELM